MEETAGKESDADSLFLPAIWKPSKGFAKKRHVCTNAFMTTNVEDLTFINQYVSGDVVRTENRQMLELYCKNPTTDLEQFYLVVKPVVLMIHSTYERKMRLVIVPLYTMALKTFQETTPTQEQVFNKAMELLETIRDKTSQEKRDRLREEQKEWPKALRDEAKQEQKKQRAAEAKEEIQLELQWAARQGQEDLRVFAQHRVDVDVKQRTEYVAQLGAKAEENLLRLSSLAKRTEELAHQAEEALQRHITAEAALHARQQADVTAREKGKQNLTRRNPVAQSKALKPNLDACKFFCMLTSTILISSLPTRT